ncbi:MAG: Luciferase-like monooxygenase [Labilithrix sp.]|nr:Luciferase-like monooxygenase [Labilithrix sp.]
MRLSVLDLSPIPSGSSAAEALRNTIDLARHAEAIGLQRYWLAEHHNAASLASSSPEIMIGAVASATTRIRVGSGGVMLPNHSPLKVAENFRVLVALHGDRIDLGVGRAAGTDPKTALALRQSRELLGVERFPEQLDELMTFLTHDPDPAASFGPTKAVPLGVTPPPLFLLGSGPDGAALAARLGVGFAFAHHISPEGHVEALRAYREAFRPSRWSREPYAILATSVLCAEDDEAAEDLLRCADLSFLRFGQGLRDLPMPSIEEARAYRFDSDEEVFRQSTRTRHVFGGPARVKDVLSRMFAETGADEIMATTNIHDHEERKRSYSRVAAALGIPPAS